MRPDLVLIIKAVDPIVTGEVAATVVVEVEAMGEEKVAGQGEDSREDISNPSLKSRPGSDMPAGTIANPPVINRHSIRRFIEGAA